METTSSVEFSPGDDLQLISHLGKGAYGQVYQVAYKGTLMALKVFEDKWEYEKEKSIHSKLDHSHIIKLLYFVDQTSSFSYSLLLELADSSLQDYLNTYKSEQRDPAICKKYASDTIKGVRYLHSKGIVHRDLKPDNILIVQGVAKLGDFGSCVENNTKCTQFGTNGYKAPEAMNLEDPPITLACDIYALSIILFLLTTKEQTKPNYSWFMHISLLLGLETPIPATVPATACVQLQYIIHKGLNRKPELRPHIEEFHNVINEQDTTFRQLKN